MSLASVVISRGLMEIGDNAFRGCESLTSVNIPEEVTEIGDGAFEGCTALAEIRFEGTREQWEAIKKGDAWNKNVPVKDVLFQK